MSRKNSILGFSEPNGSQISWYFYTYEHLKFHAQLSWAWKKFYNFGARSRLFAHRNFYAEYNKSEKSHQKPIKLQNGHMQIVRMYKSSGRKGFYFYITAFILTKY